LWLENRVKSQDVRNRILESRTKIIFKMKTKILYLSIIAMSLLAACNSNTSAKKEDAKEIHSETYQCPMKCNGIVYDKPGKCTVCEMDLEKVEKI
jgi:hypothetical protein